MKMEAGLLLKPELYASPTKNAKRPKKSKICFSPAPTVHEFDTDSPTSRRMEVRWNKIDTIDDSILQTELDARGIKTNKRKKSRIGAKEKKLLRNHWMKEMEEELERLGVNAIGDHLELAERIHLVDLLRRRAQIRMAYGNIMENVPIDMSLKELRKELEDRRIVVNKQSRKSMVEALENALAKENRGLIGDGYEFGRKMLSAAEIIESQDLNNNELRAALKRRGVKKVPIKKEQKRQLLQKLLEADLENKLRVMLHTELKSELARRSIKYTLPKSDIESAAESASNENETASKSPLGKRKREQREQKTSQNDAEIRQMFDILFSSNAWKDEFPEEESNDLLHSGTEEVERQEKNVCICDQANENKAVNG